MAKLSKRRQHALVADQHVVETLYIAACERFGADAVRADLTLIWMLRCMWGVSGALPFGTGTISKSLGELMYVAREVCRFPR